MRREGGRERERERERGKGERERERDINLQSIGKRSNTPAKIK